MAYPLISYLLFYQIGIGYIEILAVGGNCSIVIIHYKMNYCLVARVCVASVTARQGSWVRVHIPGSGKVY